jgi:hypothetical protein
MEYLELLWTTTWGLSALGSLGVTVLVGLVKLCWRPALPDGVSKDMLERNKRPKPKRKEPFREGPDSVKNFEELEALAKRADDAVGVQTVSPFPYEELLLRSRLRQGVIYPRPPESPGIEWYNPGDKLPERLGRGPTELEEKAIRGTAVAEFNAVMMGDNEFSAEGCISLVEHNLNETPAMEARNKAELAKRKKRRK